MTDSKDKVESIIDTLLGKLGVSHNGIETKEVAGQTLHCIIADESDSSLLIGQRGGGLRAINMLVSRMLENELGNNERVRITIDINDYKKAKIDAVVESAKVQADRAKELKYDVELQPSNGYERMLVHAALASDQELETGSIGEGLERRVVIKWVG